MIFSFYNNQKLVAQYFKKSPLYGIYQINTTGEKRTSIPNDWSFIIFEYEGQAQVRDNLYAPKYIGLGLDTLKKNISLNNFKFDYKQLENGELILKVKVEDRFEEIKLTKRDLKSFELMKREFNWIQEYPHNR